MVLKDYAYRHPSALAIDRTPFSCFRAKVASLHQRVGSKSHFPAYATVGNCPVANIGGSYHDCRIGQLGSASLIANGLTLSIAQEISPLSIHQLTRAFSKDRMTTYYSKITSPELLRLSLKSPFKASFSAMINGWGTLCPRLSRFIFQLAPVQSDHSRSLQVRSNCAKSHADKIGECLNISQCRISSIKAVKAALHSDVNLNSVAMC